MTTMEWLIGQLWRLTTLEKTYEERLRLEKPATYWGSRARSLRTQGYWWSGLVVFFLLGGAGYFSFLFTEWIKGQEIALSLHSFQGAVLLTVIISSFVFLVRVASRLAFSAFHLQRDAEEREQLAHVSLALVNDAKVDDESRKIVLQALFSLAETGILAGDDGPTMPASDLISSLSKGGK